MSASLILAVIAIVVSGSSALFAGLTALATHRTAKATQSSAEATQRAADAAVEQTKLQDQMRRAASQPYVWVDVRPDDDNGGMIFLLVGNSGPTVATNVRVTFDPPLPDTGIFKDGTSFARLSNGLASLPPGRTMAWVLGPSYAVGTETAGWVKHQITVCADGPLGPLEPLEYSITLNDLLHTELAPRGTLRGIASAVADVASQLRSREAYGALRRTPRPSEPPPDTGPRDDSTATT